MIIYAIVYAFLVYFYARKVSSANENGCLQEICEACVFVCEWGLLMEEAM